MSNIPKDTVATINSFTNLVTDCPDDMAVTVENVGISFGQEQVLDGIDLALEKGRIHGIVGLKRFGKNCLDEVYSRLFKTTKRAYKSIWRNHRL